MSQVVNRAVKLSLDATREIMTAPRKITAYKFLARDGSFMCEAARDGMRPDAICVDSWPRAVQVADEIGAAFVAKMHQHAVCHRNLTQYGGKIWTETVMYPHPDFFDEWDGTLYSQFEPGRSLSKTSGAAQRRRSRSKGLT